MTDGPAVWNGKIGSVPLRVSVPHAGRIEAEWEVEQGRRNKVSGSLEEFEKSVLFQVMLSGGESDPAVGREVLAAVAEAQAERPRPAPDPTAQRKKTAPRGRRRRSRRRPRR